MRGALYDRIVDEIQRTGPMPRSPRSFSAWSSTTSGSAVNSCSAPSILTAVMAAPRVTRSWMARWARWSRARSRLRPPSNRITATDSETTANSRSRPSSCSGSPDGPATIGSRKDVRSGCIGFYDPRGAANMTAIRRDPNIEAEFTVRPRAGLILLWPAFLQHFVHPNLCADPRISISFNVMLKWSDEYLPDQG